MHLTNHVPASLLMFTNDSDYMSPHFFPINKSTRSPFDHSFPSSNTGGADENNNTYLEDLRRSTVSTPSYVASNYLLQPYRSHLNSPLIHLIDYPSISRTCVHTLNWNTSPFPQFPLISTPKVLCLSINLHLLLDYICQMINSNNSNGIFILSLTTFPIMMVIMT